MFPPRAKSISLGEIADHWARDSIAIVSGSFFERRRMLRHLLAGAWWTGELPGTAPLSRLEFLRRLFHKFGSDLLFLTPGEKPPQTERHHRDGSVTVETRAVFRVPSRKPEHWTDNSVEPLCADIAQAWSLLESSRREKEHRAWRLMEPALRSVEISKDNFGKWLDACGYDRPYFWFGRGNQARGSPTANALSRTPSSAPTKTAKTEVSLLRKRGRRPDVLLTTIAAMRADIEKNDTSEEALLADKQEALASRYGVSRDTIRRALTALAEERARSPKRR